MTVFQQNEQAAMDRFADRLKPFGLEVDRRGNSGRYTDESRNIYEVRLRSRPVPVKGHKGVIDAAQADGLRINRFCNEEYNGTRVYYFTAEAWQRIPTGASEIPHFFTVNWCNDLYQERYETLKEAKARKRALIEDGEDAWDVYIVRVDVR